MSKSAISLLPATGTVAGTGISCFCKSSATRDLPRLSAPPANETGLFPSGRWFERLAVPLCRTLFYLNDLYHLRQLTQRDTLCHFRFTVTHVAGDFFRFDFIRRNVRFFRIFRFKFHFKFGFNRLRSRCFSYRFIALRDKYRSIINPF